MTDIKNLTDEELQKISGGVSLPEGVVAKYNQHDKVRYLINNWILEIVEVVLWSSNDIAYDTIIVEIPDGDISLYKIGDHYKVLESRIESI